MLKPFAPARYRRRIFSQLWMLALQFLLGMTLNFVGGESTGAWHTLYVVVLWTHILNAIGLVEGDIFIWLKAPGKLIAWATVTTIGALAAGILTVRMDSDVWSFVMAAGFLASSWLHVVLYIDADRALHPEA